ncbi:unnamed protein product [Jaminaea pallidilutea]
MTTQKLITLVTGANAGIGFAIAKILYSDPAFHVLLGSRSLPKGEAAAEAIQQSSTSTDKGSIEVVQLDVTQPASISALCEHIQNTHGRLDVLVNNAAISGFSEDVPYAQRMTECFATNVTGPSILSTELVPMLQQSISTARIVNVSSGAGSIGRMADGSASAVKPKKEPHPYSVSKAAFNMMSVSQAHMYSQWGAKVFTICPGFTQSNLSPMNVEANGARAPEMSAEPIIACIRGQRDEDHSKFIHRDGVYDW